MPRTKVIRKRKSTISEIEEDFAKQAKMRIHKNEVHFDMLLQSISNEVDVVLNSLPDEVRKVTLDLLINLDENEDVQDVSSTSEDQIPINIVPPSTVKAKKPLKRQTAASTDDGYVTESGTQQHQSNKHVSRIDKVTSTTKRGVGKSRRSSSTSQIREKTRQRSSSRGGSGSRMTNKMVTPAALRNQAEYSLVTPKVKPNTPLNVLRRPREGEMALSMQGSPLLVSAIVQDRTANINVPLHNGNVISLLPNDGLRLSHIPRLDEETMKQLKTLKGHIEKVIGNR